MTARILVVDDNPLNRKLLVAKLTRDYYIASAAESGEQAIEMVAAEKPDVILLDIMMPGMDGFTVCRHLKSNPDTADIPIIMITALSDTNSRVTGLEAGADDFLTKPINDIALMARLRSTLRLKVILDEWRQRNIAAMDSIENELSPIMQSSLVGCSIVLVEDDKVMAGRIQHTMSELGIAVKIIENIDYLLSLDIQQQPDLIMLSIDLQKDDGLRLCSNLRSEINTRNIPIILIANEEDINLVANGLDLGANDYLLRPLESSEIIARVRTQLRNKQYHDRLISNYESGLALAKIDPLTGAFNRRWLERQLPRIIARSPKDVCPGTVLMFDIDHFKAVNDTWGHLVGDQVLKSFSEFIEESLRATDSLVRLGGEEFIAVLLNTSIDDAQKVAERLRIMVSQKPMAYDAKKSPILITTSIGVAKIANGTDDNVERTINDADTALMNAKKTGRNRVVVFEDE